ncbi:MAG: Crp/Fnr family transcriptional regulator [Methylophilaceae bacterium]|uniref:Crp/Fnr family transcriptional regulator n=1 Tax=Methylovorus sp. MM2 TaxID=1848038 RepID=UPI0007E0E748|nr:Crp/Fnr family transcriptional regulator [Methylovorus sp. MM2]OAM51320.1 hypothetical protein A7981_11385 [Methylovorus sp. MM2]
MQGRYSKAEITQLLSGSFLFSELEQTALDKIADFAQVRKIPNKTSVFFKGDHGDSMFIVIKGRLKVQNISEEGKTLILGFLEPNASFGEIAVLDGKPRTATVTSTQVSELLVIDRTSFLQFLISHPSVAVQLTTVLCQMLRSTNEFLENMVFLNLPFRLAKMLRLLSLKYGSPKGENIEFDMKISQVDLANLVGASRESVNKQLRNWEDEGLLVTLDDGRLNLSKKLLDINDQKT